MAGPLIWLAIAAQVGDLAIPHGTFMMVNNSAVPLTCRVRTPLQFWSPSFRLGAGQSREEPSEGVTSLEVLCDPPAQQKIYTIEPGERYAWLRDDRSSPVTLRRIVP